MNRLSKSLTILLMIIAMLCSVTVSAAAVHNSALWEDSKYYSLLNAGGVSNSDLCYAAVKVRYDRSANRIHLLFLLEFKELNDVNLSGLIMDFNSLGEIRLITDGTAEYDDDIYFAELNDEAHDKNSKNVILEATVGIKSGIPDNVIMDVYIIDTNGVKSNLYTVDITDRAEDDTSEYKTEKTSRTTKAKTTKHKTTKVKTSRTQKSKTSGTEKVDVTEETQIVIGADINNVETNNRRKKIMIVLGASATAVSVAAGCTAGIRNRKKDKDGGH